MQIFGKKNSRMALNHVLILYNYRFRHEREGHGFVMPGWQGPGRSPGVSKKEKGQLCALESEVAWIEMLLLGYSDMLVASKRSQYVHMPKAMVLARSKTYCQTYKVPSSIHGNMARVGDLSYYCHMHGGQGGLRAHLATKPMNSTGSGFRRR